MSSPLALLLLLVVLATPVAAQDTQDDPTASQKAAVPQVVPVIVSCASKPGERTQCAADTSSGVVLLRSTGEAPCLLGKTWGYDQGSVWVSDGCSADFSTGIIVVEPATTKPKPLSHIPNVGFLLVAGDKGEMYLRLFSYGRYLNQRNLDASYVDAFGNTKTVQRRQDVQLQKFFAPFSGWFLTPKMRYYLYVWSSNPSQGDPAQVVGAGNLTWSFNRFVSVGVGITSLPTVRSTEGQFPYWLGVDDRLIADEFFRGSYTSGVWLKGELHTKLKYMAMFANNLSTLGVSASQLDNRMDTQSFSLQWLPTTGEFGLWNGFGDYDAHQKVATRIGVHYSHSLEEKQSQPGTEGIENSQIRLTDGSVIFTPDLFGPGITVNEVDYRMASVDAGVKYKGMAVEGEYYWRWLSNFTGLNTGSIADIKDTGYQLQTSAMVVPKTLQLYVGASQVFGNYGDPWEVRVGQNWYLMKERGIRLNGEWMYVEGSPVGYTAYPYPVGARGQVFHINLELNF
ncbi:hypothetical protein LuPra_02372 [Luteitalea pratensis]|uniref:Porin n=1 Tax=Luteitalea pratensis TaxID=1855912 RepID=A0A143PN15_LUTPR|nr:DUF3011 domain-containing protein [Luteitalea pratensis]AMY09159.1 hypothetical protein LuPra_02372 [Luteitalea pratensis]